TATASFGFLAGPAAGPAQAAVTAAPTPPQVYGAWHCSNDACLWGSVRDMTDFDHNNHWLIDRGDGRPSVNLVVLSFVNPLRLLNGTTDAQTLNGTPLAARAGRQANGGLAAYRRPGTRLRQRDGGLPPAEQRHRRPAELAGRSRRKVQLLAADPAAGPGQVHRQLVHRRGQQGPAGVHELRQLVAEVDGPLCADRRAQRRRQHGRDARVLVLGGRTTL